jgi:hypothetical protein
MSCHAWQQLLQQHLDGRDGELEHHLHSCQDCAGEQPAVQRLLDGITLLAPISAPAGLAERITEQLLLDVRRQRRLRQRRLLASLGTLAAAAAVLIAVGFHSWRAERDTPEGSRTGPAVVRKEEPLPPSTGRLRNPAPRSGEGGERPLRDSLAQAGTAVASLTSRAASETMDQTSSLLPLLPAPSLEPIAPEAAPMEPLREASAEVSAGLAPVADSARRAVGLFLRDLPVGRNGG